MATTSTSTSFFCQCLPFKIFRKRDHQMASSSKSKLEMSVIEPGSASETPCKNKATTTVQLSNNSINELNASIKSYQSLQRRLLIIINPISGKGKASSIFLHKVSPILTSAGILATVLITEYQGHARSVVSSEEQDISSDFHGIVVFSGDGLINEVINGLRSRRYAYKCLNLPIGVIPGGSGNGLARSIASYGCQDLEYLNDPIISCTMNIANGNVRPVNLTEVNLDGYKIYSFLSVGLGLISDIDIESERLRRLGEKRFYLWTLYCLLKYRIYNASLWFIPFYSPDSAADFEEINLNDDDGDSIQDERNPETSIHGNFVSIYSSTQSYIASDMLFAPKAKSNDGLIHLSFIKHDIGRIKLTQFCLGIDKGEHLSVPGVESVTTKEFTLLCPDGFIGNLTIDGEKVTGSSIVVKISENPLIVYSG